MVDSTGFMKNTTFNEFAKQPSEIDVNFDLLQSETFSSNDANVNEETQFDMCAEVDLTGELEVKHEKA